ncbi:MAG: TIGR03915 family putative DNA repair protein [Bacillota bacterium]
MNFYIYDGSFPGLLTAVYHAFYNEEKPDNILSSEVYKTGLFDNKIHIKTDTDKSDRVYQAIKDKISLYSLRKIYNTYLSEEANREILIYRYLILGFKLGKKIDKSLNNDIVDQLNKISSKVSKEKHLILGLLRFKKIKGDIYYAPVEPDYNIISLIAPHFAKRMADQNWIIHDCKRLTAAVFNQEEWILTEMKKHEELDYTEEETFYQKLWQGFYDNIAIENRRNPRLQRQYMPRRYWKYLVEK